MMFQQHGQFSKEHESNYDSQNKREYWRRLLAAIPVLGKNASEGDQELDICAECVAHISFEKVHVTREISEQNNCQKTQCNQWRSVSVLGNLILSLNKTITLNVNG